MLKTKIIQTATTVPEHSYSQEELISILGITSEKGQRFFKHDHISKRHLDFKRENLHNQKVLQEDSGKLRENFKISAINLSKETILKVIKKAQITLSDIDYIACVTSTGFLVPGLSAHLSQELGLKKNCQRLDIVGMGCNAGLNGLNATKCWSESNPGKYALLVCSEICSSIYSLEENENAHLVNSLFGDGVAATLLFTDNLSKGTITIEDFETQLIPQSLHCLRFDWNSDKNLYSFYVDKKTPEVLAKNIKAQFESLLSRNKIDKSQIKHWIFHSGGSAILEGIRKVLDLEKNDIRHTESVLREMGNISSGSFLFSFERLIEENNIQTGDFGLMATMGPGLTIEMALIKWN